MPIEFFNTPENKEFEFIIGKRGDGQRNYKNSIKARKSYNRKKKELLNDLGSMLMLGACWMFWIYQLLIVG